uniref:alkaline phosphatase n=1 Tax=Timema genevievae TaxID=629358 RepID=A0A7R9K7L7_TIMGE|nr:unnamed protein product [Timema genevievae]
MHLRGERVTNHFVKTTLNTPDRDSNLDLPVIGSLVYCESSTLDYAATEVDESVMHPLLNDVPTRTSRSVRGEQDASYWTNSGQEELYCSVPPYLVLQTLANWTYNASYWTNSGQEELWRHATQQPILVRAKNVILFLGDGMSIPTLAATRAYLGQRSGQTGEEVSLSFERFPYTGLSKTYCVDRQVADSACSSTAYFCGVKNNYGTLGVSATVTRRDCQAMRNSSNHVDSILVWAQDAGKSTGLVTTTRITHASPAGGYSHTAERNWESDADVASNNADPHQCADIAKQLVRNSPGKNVKVSGLSQGHCIIRFIRDKGKIIVSSGALELGGHKVIVSSGAHELGGHKGSVWGTQVVLGGGRRAFRPNTVKDEEGKRGVRIDGADLVDEWKRDKLRRGASNSYVWDRDGLLGVNTDTTEYLLGLFDHNHMQYHLDADPTTEPTLPEMTATAIKMLQKDKAGYFLFVEEQPESVDATEQPESVDTTEQPESVDTTEQPESVDTTEQPESVDTTEQPESVDTTEQPESVDTTEQPESVDTTEQPESVDTTEQPESVDATEQPESVNTTEQSLVLEVRVRKHLEKQPPPLPPGILAPSRPQQPDYTSLTIRLRGRIDHAHHGTSAKKALDETVQFHEAVRVAAELTEEKDTLIVVTSDHAHVMSYSGYPTRGNDILVETVTVTLCAVETAIVTLCAVETVIVTLCAVETLTVVLCAVETVIVVLCAVDTVIVTLCAVETVIVVLYAGVAGNSVVDRLPYSTISYGNGPGYRPPQYDGRRYDISRDNTRDKNYMFPALLPLNSETHGGDDVGVFARGPWAHLFTGVYEQHVIPHMMAFASCIGRGLTACWAR